MSPPHVQSLLCYNFLPQRAQGCSNFPQAASEEGVGHLENYHIKKTIVRCSIKVASFDGCLKHSLPEMR